MIVTTVVSSIHQQIPIETPGQTVWVMVCEWEMHEQISNLLIQAGADKHALVGHMSPLYSVSAGGTAPVVRLLLRQGVNPVIQTSYKLASLVRTTLLMPSVI